MSDHYGNGSAPAAPTPATPPASSSPRRYVRGHGVTFHTIDGERGAVAYAARCICGEYRCSSDAGELDEQVAAHLNAHAFSDGVR